MATQPVDRQRAKHALRTAPKHTPLTYPQKQKEDEHRAWAEYHKWQSQQFWWK